MSTFYICLLTPFWFWLGMNTPGRRKSSRLKFPAGRTTAIAVSKPEQKGKSKLQESHSSSLCKETVEETSKVNHETEDDFFQPVLPVNKKRRERSKPRQFIPCTVPDCKRKYYFNWKIEQHIFLVSYTFTRYGCGSGDIVMLLALWMDFNNLLFSFCMSRIMRIKHLPNVKNADLNVSTRILQ